MSLMSHVMEVLTTNVESRGGRGVEAYIEFK